MRTLFRGQKVLANLSIEHKWQPPDPATATGFSYDLFGLW